MSKLKLLGIAVAGLILINLALLAFVFFAKPPRPEAMQTEGRPPFPMREPKEIIIERLHLDKEQVAQYEILIQQHRKTINETDRQIGEVKNNLYITLSDGNTSVKDSLQNVLAGLQREIENTHYNHFEAIKKLCKPEQLPAFTELTKELARFFAPRRNGPPPSQE
jgi:periplasmic protein CpxP/Spy